jgi:RimJ/RimL family protein N-acetyltransferase
VTLRALAAGDAEAVFGALRIPGFTDGLLLEPPSDVGEVRRAIEEDAERWRRGEAYSFAVVADADVAGRVDLRPDRFVAGALNLGFWIERTKWGRGLATDAGHAALRIAFEELGCREVWAGAATWNEPSHVVLRRLGFRHREHRRHGYRKNGRWVANERYCLTGDAWSRRRPPMPGL